MLQLCVSKLFLWCKQCCTHNYYQAEVESSRTHFEVLGLEASSPRKLACPWLENSSIFWMLKFCGALEKFFGKRFLVEIAGKIFVKTCFFFGEHLRFVSLVLGLGLKHSCPWPRECLSSERLSLALASDFFCVLGLGLELCVLDSTSVTRLYFRRLSTEEL